MATIIKDLGAVTAYGYAKEKGYTGTEDEYAELMASYATVAEETAESAAESKASEENAQAYAQTATEKASDAAGSAATATSKASEASASATSASGSAATATQKASDASSSASAAETSATQAAGSATGASSSATAAAASATAAANAQTAAETAQSAAEDAQEAAEAAAEEAQTYAESYLNAFATDTASGPIASFPDGADNVPMKDVVCEINPVQSGSGDPSPDNVRPISGFTGLTVTRTGKNLLPPFITQDGANFVVLGQDSAYGHKLKLKAGTYTVSLQTTNLGTFYYRTDVEDVSVRIGDHSATNATFVLEKDTTMRMYYYKSGGIAASEISNTQIELGSTATDYEPYSGEAYPISWQTEAGTVYGGTLDVTTGVLTVDRAMVDLGTLTLTYNSTGKAWQTDGITSTVKRPATNDSVVNAICDKATAIRYSAGFGLDSVHLFANTNGRLYINNASDSTSPTGQLCYELDTPIVYDLTPTEVTTLLAQNNIWHDANGDTIAAYRADTALYIDKKLSTITAMLTAYVEASMTASRAYAVNDFINANGQLYRVTAPIANGGTITPGTNATATTIGTQLTTIINS